MQLTDRVYLVGSGAMGFGMTDPFDCHIYLVDGGDELALIDVGAGMGVPAILGNIRAHGFDPAAIRHIVLTHAHGDHGGGAARMRRALSDRAAVYLHKEAAGFLRNGDEEGISLSFAKEKGMYPADYYLEPCPVDVDVEEGMQIRVGDLQLDVLNTPGHCSGHASFVMCHDQRTYFFGGDLVFFGGRVLFQNIYDCSLQEHASSLAKVAELDIDIFLPGHLTFSLSDGRRHIDAALGYFQGGLVPPNLTHSWV